MRLSENKYFSSRILSCVFGLALALWGSSVFAYKVCLDQKISYIFNDGTHTFIASSGSKLNGAIRSTNPEYKSLVSIALAAKVSGNNITVRYSDDSVTCGSTAWSDSIVGLGF